MVLTILTPTSGMSSGAATIKAEWISRTLSQGVFFKMILVKISNGRKVVNVPKKLTYDDPGNPGVDI